MKITKDGSTFVFSFRPHLGGRSQNLEHISEKPRTLPDTFQKMLLAQGSVPFFCPMPLSPRKKGLQAVVDGSSYLDDHGLTGWIDTIVQDLLEKKPEDPWEFLEAEVKKVRAEKKAKKEVPEKAAEKKEESFGDKAAEAGFTIKTKDGKLDCK